MKADHMQCSCCNGKGTVPIGDTYQETLAIVRRFCKSNGFVVANHDAEWFGCQPTALNNRLRRLEELGFLKSEWHGKQRRYMVR